MNLYAVALDGDAIREIQPHHHLPLARGIVRGREDSITSPILSGSTVRACSPGDRRASSRIG